MKTRVSMILIAATLGSSLISVAEESPITSNQISEDNSPTAASIPTESKPKLGVVVPVGEYYTMVRNVILGMAKAQTDEEFFVFYAQLEKKHRDDKSFRIGCILFYQYRNMMSGLDNNFSPPFHDWMRVMGADLHGVISRALELRESPESKEVLVLFASQFRQPGMTENVAVDEENMSLETARSILVKVLKKLEIFKV